MALIIRDSKTQRPLRAVRIVLDEARLKPLFMLVSSPRVVCAVKKSSAPPTLACARRS